MGIPVSSREVVLLLVALLTPAGNEPETIFHEYGVQPPLAMRTAKYDSPRMPLGMLVVSMVTDAMHRDANTISKMEKKKDFMIFMVRRQSCFVIDIGGFRTNRGFRTIALNLRMLMIA